MMRSWRFTCLITMIFLVLALTTAGVAAREKERDSAPAAQITIHATQVAAGLGYTWGDGVLEYKGKEYKFKVKGLSMIAVGISSLNAKGEVYNLENLDDFAGRYLGVEEGAAMVVGSGGLVMKNLKGVVINLHAQQKGVNLKLGDEGLTITPAWD